MNASCDLSIVIVTWNTRELVLDCLASLHAAKLALRHEVLLVDNGSGDGTAEAVRRQFPEVTVISLPENRGFAAGSNQGLLKMNGRHAVLLNSDTIVLPDQLERCVRYLDAHPDVGVVGPLLLNPDRTRQNSVHNVPTLFSEIVSQSLLRRLRPSRYPSRAHLHREPIEVEAVLGACMFVRGEVVHEVGPLDEDYFCFLEETDWCHRIRRRGWKVVHVPDACVIHLHGASSKTRAPLRTRIEYQRSLDLFFRKHRGRLAHATLRAFLFAKLCVGSLVGGRRARDYRAILRWNLAGMPEGWGLQGVSELAETRR
jgi:GT2 family glycosyltransferase